MKTPAVTHLKKKKKKKLGKWGQALGLNRDKKKISWFHSNIWIQAQFYLTFNITLNCAHVHVAYIKVILFYSFLYSLHFNMLCYMI